MRKKACVVFVCIINVSIVLVNAVNVIALVVCKKGPCLTYVKEIRNRVRIQCLPGSCILPTGQVPTVKCPKLCRVLLIGMWLERSLSIMIIIYRLHSQDCAGCVLKALEPHKINAVTVYLSTLMLCLLCAQQ